LFSYWQWLFLLSIKESHVTSTLVGGHEFLVSFIKGKSVFFVETEVVLDVGKRILKAHLIQCDKQYQAHQRAPEARRTSAAEARPPVDATNKRTAVNTSIEVRTSGIIGGDNLLYLPQGVRRNEREGALHVRLVRNQTFARIATPVLKYRKDEMEQGIEASTLCF
jgi:hypothetical protein